MPGISQGYSMAAHANIGKALRNTFTDPQSLSDALKILDLTEKAKMWEDRMLESHIALTRFMFWALSGFIVIDTFFALVSRSAQLHWTMLFLWLVPILTALELRWSKSRRLKAKKEIELLVKSDSDYWQPLVDRVMQIVINYGNSTHSLLGSRQVTKIANEK